MSITRTGFSASLTKGFVTQKAFHLVPNYTIPINLFNNQNNKPKLRIIQKSSKKVSQSCFSPFTVKVK